VLGEKGATMKYLVAGLGIISIAGLEGYALAQGINGTTLSLSFGAICTIIGYIIGRKTSKPG